MNGLKRAIALTILTLWVPVAMHCALETLPGFGFLQSCCGEAAAAPAPGDCDTDFCSAIESGLYKLEENPTFAPDPAAPLIPATCVGREVALPDPGPPRVAVGPSPPELPRSWQFLQRTARSPRAPSFAA